MLSKIIKETRIYNQQARRVYNIEEQNQKTINQYQFKSGNNWNLLTINGIFGLGFIKII